MKVKYFENQNSDFLNFCGFIIPIFPLILKEQFFTNVSKFHQLWQKKLNSQN
jgi:hypothetical protein